MYIFYVKLLLIGALFILYHLNREKGKKQKIEKIEKKENIE